jgi:hypothetical protein
VSFIIATVQRQRVANCILDTYHECDLRLCYIMSSITHVLQARLAPCGSARANALHQQAVPLIHCYSMRWRRPPQAFLRGCMGAQSERAACDPNSMNLVTLWLRREPPCETRGARAARRARPTPAPLLWRPEPLIEAFQGTLTEGNVRPIGLPVSRDTQPSRSSHPEGSGDDYNTIGDGADGLNRSLRAKRSDFGGIACTGAASIQK